MESIRWKKEKCIAAHVLLTAGFAMKRKGAKIEILRGIAMRRKDMMELAETPGAVLVAEIAPERNKYFIKLYGAYYKINSPQFEYLIESGIFCTKYSVDLTGGMGCETQIYERR